METKLKYSRILNTSFPEYNTGKKQGSYKKVLLFELFICFVAFSGVLIFSQGFLLTRRALENESQCGNINKGDLWNQKLNELNLTKSTNDTLENIQQNENNIDNDSCWYPKKFDKAVIFVIDALRYDFINWVDPSEATKHYQNNLPIINEVLQNEPKHSFKFQFKSDPPTTTLQRLKGLTTGTLPTFIEAGKNFAGTTIMEDNLIKKLISKDKRILFMGDDTWVSIYPDYLNETNSYPCDSLNVWDLHTTDNTIRKHLFPALMEENKSWDIIIAHTLGVDHCGHHYGPDTDYMTNKLKEMNNDLKKIIENLDDDTILLVMGDHGMDSRGDHGGESDNELNAGLFAYCKKDIFPDINNSELYNDFLKKLKPVEIESQREIVRTVPQIDFPPTLSLLLGLPIPYESLGTIIPEFFWYPSQYSKNKNEEVSIYQNILEALRVNMYQTSRFTKDYTNNKKDSAFGNKLLKSYEKAETRFKEFLEINPSSELIKDTEELEGIILDYIHFNRQMIFEFRQIWAKFNEPLYYYGLCIITLAVICQIIYIITPHNIVDFNANIFFWYPFGCGSLSVLLINSGSLTRMVKYLFNTELVLEPLQMFLGGFSFGACVGYILGAISMLNSNSSDNEDDLKSQKQSKFENSFKYRIISYLKKIDVSDVIAVTFIVTQGIFQFSNSYIVHEDSVVQYMLQSIAIFKIYKAVTQPFPQIRNKIIFFTVVFMIITRITVYSDLCREEQYPECVQTFITTPVIYIVYVASLLFFPIYLKKVINENYYGVSKIIIKYLIPSGLFLSAIYWGIDSLEQNNLIKDELYFLKNLKYIVGKYGFMIIPIFAIIIWASMPITFDAKVKGNSQHVLTFYGLKNHLGSAYLLFIGILVMFFTLVSKPMGSLMIIFSFCQIVCVLQVTSLERESIQLQKEIENYWKNKKPETKYMDGANNKSNSTNSTKKSENENNNTTDIDNKLETYILSDGTEIEISSEELINIASSDMKSSFNVSMLTAVTLSLLSHHIFFRTGHQTTIQSIDWAIGFIGSKELNFIKAGFLITSNVLAGIFLCCFAVPIFVFWRQDSTKENEKPMLISLTKALTKYSLSYSIPQVLAIFSTSIHRRHLMEWKIFAPRYMFGGISLVVVDLLCIISVVILYLIIRGSNNFLKNLRSTKN